MVGSTKTDEIRHEVLVKLYESYFVSYDAVNLRKALEDNNWGETEFSNVVARLGDEGYLRGRPGWFYMMTPRGALHVEQIGFAPEQLHKENEKCRTEILLLLAKIYEEKGRLHSAMNSELRAQSSVGPELVTPNLYVLLESGYVEQFGNGGSRITHYGIDAVHEYRIRVGLGDEFERISNIDPRPRGSALQKLIARVIQHEGWGQEESARTSNEEMDIIVFRAREYYLTEAKWEKDPVEAGVIRELFGKLSNRAEFRGILFSMSGVTKGAIKQVQDYVNQRIILVFGPDDLKSLIYGKTTFEELLNEKYREIGIRRTVQFQ